MKKNQKTNLTEQAIISKYLKKLNFNKSGTFNFENDAAYIKFKKNKKIVVTTDAISENTDFFYGDNPKSIANKIITINLSDLSAMGVSPFAYSLNLFLPKYINKNWIKIFTNELFKLQKTYNFYLLGGDLSASNTLSIVATFFGYSKKNKIISQNSININNDIWITDNIGDSFVGLQILNKKIKTYDNKLDNYFTNKYYYPKPCMIGENISTYVKSMKDISDGFVGDLKKMLDNKYGAQINVKKLPISRNLQKILNEDVLSKSNILNVGDNYNLIIISDIKYRKKILEIAKNKKTKITIVGKIIKKKEIIDDSNNTLNIPKEFDHFR